MADLEGLLIIWAQWPPCAFQTGLPLPASLDGSKFNLLYVILSSEVSQN